MATGLPQTHIPAFDATTDLSSQATKWKKWIARLEVFFIAHAINDSARKKAILLLYAGETVTDIYDSIPDAEKELAEGEDAYEKVKSVLTTKFDKTINLDFEINQFRSCVQKQGQTLDQYYSLLCKLASTCGFDNNDKEIRTQIIQNCSSGRVRRKALREKLTLQQILDFARSIDLSEYQASHMENSSVPVETVNHAYQDKACRGKAKYKPQQRGSNTGNSTNNKCRNCGLDYPHRDKPCPAKGKQCKSCQKLNHYARCCRSSGTQTQANPKLNKKHVVNQVHIGADMNNDLSSSDEEYVFSVHGVNAPLPYATVCVNKTFISAIVDTGSTINIIDKVTYDSMESKPELIQCSSPIFTYGSDTPLDNLLGYFEANVTFKDINCYTKFHVVNMKTNCIIGHMSAVQLKLVEILNSINVSDVGDKTRVTSNVDMMSDKLVKQYAHVFEGVGKLKGYKVKLHIDNDVKPTAQKHRRIPFHRRKAVETELNRQIDNDIIEPATGPTPWVSQIVTVPKKDPNAIRICADMRLPNQAILRERHVTPTNDELIHDLNGAAIFSKLDLNAGYHQLELHEDSRYITTFSTHMGLYRYKRLPFGISCAAEIFQNTIEQVIAGVPGTRNISDDIIVFGKNQCEHDKNLSDTFKRISDNGLTLNKTKCVFNKTRLEYNGNIYSAEGVMPDPKKVEAIRDFPTPQNASEVRSLLGMATYCSRFICDFATVSAPLRELTRKKVPFVWTNKHDNAIACIRESLANASSMSYYDPNKETELVCDASPVGLGCILAQKDNSNAKPRIVAYASRSLSDVESRYSQTEREALSLVWGCEHFKLYLLGREFNLITDHKPLECIFNNPNSKPPARIERWALRLQAFDYNVLYRQGSDNPADFMSRHPVNMQTTSAHAASESAEQYINHICSTAIPKAMSIDEVIEETKNDKTMQALQTVIKSNHWHRLDEFDSEIRREIELFKNVRNELCISSKGLILRGSRIILPRSLRKQAVDLAHEGHQGITRTKQLLREKVWFPMIDHLAETTVSQCIACQATTGNTVREPLNMTELPKAPWTNVSIDFSGPYKTGEYILVVIDDYSRYAEVDIVHSTSANAVIPKLDRIFSAFSIPEIVRTDNGPPFNGTLFAQYAKEVGFIHRKVTPLWPQANGEVEQFMRNINKTVTTAIIDGHPWKQQLFRYLRNYRATPHASTKTSPFELMFSRKMRVKLPEIVKPVRNHLAKQNDKLAKAKMKANAEKRLRISEQTLNVGDQVLVKNSKKGKGISKYNPNPLRVVKIKGSMITAQNDKCVITRNSSFFKRVHVNDNKNGHSCDSVEVDYSSDDEYEMQVNIENHVNNPVIPVQPVVNVRYPRRENRRLPLRYRHDSV